MIFSDSPVPVAGPPIAFEEMQGRDPRRVLRTGIGIDAVLAKEGITGAGNDLIDASRPGFGHLIGVAPLAACADAGKQAGGQAVFALKARLDRRIGVGAVITESRPSRAATDLPEQAPTNSDRPTGRRDSDSRS